MIWRRGYFGGTHDADYFASENKTGKAIVYGWDKAGRTCLYLNPAAQNTSDQDKQTEHLFFMMERCIEVMLPGQETVVMLVTFKNLMQSPQVGLGRAVLKILQTHYPERLGLALTANGEVSPVFYFLSFLRRYHRFVSTPPLLSPPNSFQNRKENNSTEKS